MTTARTTRKIARRIVIVDKAENIAVMRMLMTMLLMLMILLTQLHSVIQSLSYNIISTNDAARLNQYGATHATRLLAKHAKHFCVILLVQ